MRVFYEPRNGHGLPHNPFSAIVVPRPIGWISTRDADGTDNLAPYSFFNAVAYTPPQVMVASTSRKADRERGKDTLSNIEATGVFCVNIVPYEMRHAMNRTSASLPRGTDEFAAAKIAKAPCTVIDCARVADVPAALECRLTRVVDLEGENNHVAFGEVVGVHLRDDCIVDGIFDVRRFRPLARLGYRDYTVVERVFSLQRPDD